MLQKSSNPISSKQVKPSEEELSFPREEALQLYKELFLTRWAETRIRQEYGKDEMKTPVHLGVGGEAIPIGVCHTLPAGTAAFGTYRNHSLYLALTGDVDGFFAELYGKLTGPGKGKSGSMHLCNPEKGLMATSAVVATTLPVAVGMALAHRYQDKSSPVVAFFGDGALEEGVFWESLNFASLHRLKILFVCEDNGLAIHTPTSHRQGFRSIPEAVSGFRCQVASGDGSDVVGVVQKARELLQRMESDGMPGFLHLTYYRFLEHVGPNEDFDKGYRRRPTPEELERLDPLLRYEKLLRRNGFSEGDLRAVQDEVQQRVDRAVQAARSAPFPGREELLTDLFS